MSLVRRPGHVWDAGQQGTCRSASDVTKRPKETAMEIRLLVKTFAFILLIVLGIPGNVFILLKFACIKIVEKKLLPANIIILVLILSNITVIFSRVLPQALAGVGVEHLLNDLQCKFVFWSFRLSRAMSICGTSFLSIYQCTRIAQVNTFWSIFRPVITQNVTTIIALLFGINLSIYCVAFYFTNARGNTTTSPYTLQLVYCTSDFKTYESFIVYGSILIIRDIISLVLMALSSSYIVYVLIQHAKSIHGKRSSDRGQNTTIEHKASRSVILLVIMYVLLYGMDNTIWIYSLSMTKVDPEINEIRVLFATSYSALNPFIFIATNPKLQQKISSIWKKKAESEESQKKSTTISLTQTISM
ncbi:olfactory receptor class A-like protein 1 [Hyla sarda]|uniref:olfactory receptor class A-like protein 1 n=1 Tax=Hyla sarda TaxID=327740 RepID=UPI0024C2D93E|nr:olfactory receptor class A-like protein 1 [Hyla sarda]